MKKIVVYGAGEFGSLISNVISYHSNIKIIAYADDDSSKIGLKFDGLPIYGIDDLLNFAYKNEIKIAIVSIGNNKIRAEKYFQLKKAGFEMLSIVHPKALIDTKVKYGDNVIIEMGAAIHTNSKIGNNVFLGGEALVGHHNIIGNHVLVGGNVSLGGSVIIEDYVTIGVGASIKPGIRLGKGSVIGVGAAVIQDVSPGDVVAGVPAVKIK